MYKKKISVKQVSSFFSSKISNTGQETWYYKGTKDYHNNQDNKLLHNKQDKILSYNKQDKAHANMG